MTTDEKELLALCEKVLKDNIGTIFWDIAAELKRRIEQPSEREKVLVAVQPLQMDYPILPAAFTLTLSSC